jgi:hypothetical protein
MPLPLRAADPSHFGLINYFDNFQPVNAFEHRPFNYIADPVCQHCCAGSARARTQELGRAEIVEPHVVSGDIVTLSSEVRLKDLNSGEVKAYTLIFPSQARTENRRRIVCFHDDSAVNAALLAQNAQRWTLTLAFERAAGQRRMSLSLRLNQWNRKCKMTA